MHATDSYPARNAQAYKHERCLVKHRWEHTAHWKSSSHLLLSKHQQVQLLEAAAILKAAQSGASLPDEKSYWSVSAAHKELRDSADFLCPSHRPAAVSPPASGLLGSSPTINIHALTLNSPRLVASRSLHPDHSMPLHPSPFAAGSFYEQDEYEQEREEDRQDGSSPNEQDVDEDDTGESVSTGEDPLVDSMFEMELEEEDGARARSTEVDSGFGSGGSTNGVKGAGPVLGYF